MVKSQKAGNLKRVGSLERDKPTSESVTPWSGAVMVACAHPDNRMRGALMASLRELTILTEPRRKPRSKSGHGTEGEHLGGDEAQESYGLLVGLNRWR